MTILFTIKFILFFFILSIIIGVICSFTYYYENNKKRYYHKKKIQSPNLEGLNDYEKTYIFLGGRK